jgi:hypothetical protein
LRVRKAEFLFLFVIVALLAAIVWSFANSAQQVGPYLHGIIRNCTAPRTRTTVPRQCTVQLSDHTTVVVYDQIHHTDDPVIVAAMKYRLSRRSYYTVVRRDEP